MKEFTRLFIAIGIGFAFQVRAISTIDTQFQYTTNGAGFFITKRIGSAGAAGVTASVGLLFLYR